MSVMLACIHKLDKLLFFFKCVWHLYSQLFSQKHFVSIYTFASQVKPLFLILSSYTVAVFSSRIIFPNDW